MTIRELRILPPFAISRLGSADEPMENYVLEDEPERPLAFRRIVGAETLIVDEATGEICHSYVPTNVTFQVGDKIRPVAPFLELFAVVSDASGVEWLKAVDADLLNGLGLEGSTVEWRVNVANRKVVRRTGDPNDGVTADTGWFSDHDVHRLHGHSKNFIDETVHIDFGEARFIRPNAAYPGLRLRFHPAKGLIYGPHGVKDDIIPDARKVYDTKKGKWYHFDQNMTENETLPPSLYAIDPPAPTWLNDNVAVSRGYLDDACDGFVEVRLTSPKGKHFSASARVCAGPPAVVPDSAFVRTLADDLDQVLNGPKVSDDEPYYVTRDRAFSD